MNICFLTGWLSRPDRKQKHTLRLLVIEELLLIENAPHAVRRGGRWRSSDYGVGVGVRVTSAPFSGAPIAMTLPSRKLMIELT